LFTSDFMKRIVNIPEKIEVEINNFKVRIKGPKGSLERDFSSPIFKNEITIKKEDNKILLSTESDKRKIKSMLGTIEAHIKNMFTGLIEGYTAKLKIVYAHFPFTLKISGKEILINNFLGEKVPRKTRIINDCKVEIQGDEIIITGIDRESVGQTAANMEKSTWIKARDRRVFVDGIFITKKP